jgi:hypothetical protein
VARLALPIRRDNDVHGLPLWESKQETCRMGLFVRILGYHLSRGDHIEHVRFRDTPLEHPPDGVPSELCLAESHACASEGGWQCPFIMALMSAIVNQALFAFSDVPQ